MAKSKNHTNHNQNKKAHRNGIKKVKTGRFASMKGVILETFMRITNLLLFLGLP